jgi:hypothetical protein
LLPQPFPLREVQVRFLYGRFGVRGYHDQVSKPCLLTQISKMAKFTSYGRWELQRFCAHGASPMASL